MFSRKSSRSVRPSVRPRPSIWPTFPPLNSTLDYRVNLETAAATLNSLTGVEEESGGLAGLEVERDFVVGGEDGVDAAPAQVVGEVLAAAERRLGRQNG